jgi:endosialidase-like protein
LNIQLQLTYNFLFQKILFMKKKIFFTIGCVTLLSSTAIIAQDWHVAGNNVATAVGTFGTLNNKTIEFISNGAKQGTLTKGGLWGFGTLSPSAKVHINSNSATGQFPLRVGIDGSTKFWVSNNGGVGIGIPQFDVTPANGLYVFGNTGIGTIFPEANLHVFRGSAGTITAQPNAPLVVENSTDNYINLLAPSANKRGILFGDNLNNAAGGIIYSNNIMEFRTNGNKTQMLLSQGATYTLEVFGSALAIDGMWVDSDLKLKKDINDFSSALDVIKQLRPKTYFFKKEEYKNLNLSSSKQHGFVAQELEKVLPELVQSSQQPVRIKANGEPEMEDVKSVNYIELIPILTKALQEQQQQIDELKQQVNQLSVSKGATENTASAKTTDIAVSNALEQNIPNPFNHTTTINYTLPKQFTNAQIIIRDQNGNALKRTTVSGTGKGILNLDATAFSSGTYTYSLVVDGHLIDTKKMVLTK